MVFIGSPYYNKILTMCKFNFDICEGPYVFINNIVQSFGKVFLKCNCLLFSIHLYQMYLGKFVLCVCDE